MRRSRRHHALDTAGQCESGGLGDWNPVWDWAVGRFPGGWTVEAAVPFKSLRYQPGAAQVWGFNARRQVKWKNEIAFLARIPAAFGIGRGSVACSRARFVQYNSTTRRTSANVRLRWEYRPESELFVVYNEERDTLARGFPDLQNRAFIVKINRLFRF